MNNIDNPNQTRRGRMSIGSAAARGREELEKFEDKERLRKEAVKKEKESLERQLSQLESQARQAARAENLKEEKRFNDSSTTTAAVGGQRARSR